MVRGLSDISRKFILTCEKRRSAIAVALTDLQLKNIHRDSILKYSVISIFDAWGYFCRSVIVASSVGGIATSSGRVIPNGTFRSYRDAVIASRTDRLGKVRDEPHWHDASTAISIARKFSVANFAEIANALGDTNSPSEQIRLLRNFCAHERNADCYEKLIRSNWKPEIQGKSVESVLVSLQSDGRKRYEFWLDELQVLAIAAVQ